MDETSGKAAGRGLSSALRIASRILRRPALAGDYLALALKLARTSGLAGLTERARRERAPEPAADSYRDWIAAYDTLSDADRAAIAARIAAMPQRPLISILTPVYDTPEPVLRRCIASVQAQLYPDWELCLVDDASTRPHVRAVCEAAAAADPRIRFLARDANGHIAAASNSALAMARGQWSALLDHDDELAPLALYRVAEAVAARPDLDLLFSDEDKIDLDGRRFDPWFKPDWNADQMLAQNAVLHLAVYRTELMRRIGGFREGFEGSQDHDLVLRFAEQTAPDRIAHLPYVLYHWRTIAGSVAAEAGEKAYAYENGRRAVEEHLRRTGQPAAVGHDRSPGRYRVRWALSEPAPRVAVVVEGADARARASLAVATDYPGFEVVGQPGESDGPVIAFLAAGAAPMMRDWLAELVALALRPGVGAAGAKLCGPDLTVVDGERVLGLDGLAGCPDRGRTLEDPGYYGRAQCARLVSAIAGCVVLRRDVLDRVGGLDRQALPSPYAELDLCLRLRAIGLSIAWTPSAQFVLRRPGAHDVEARRQAERRLVERWGEALAVDPFFNPNLALDSRFLPAFPPRLGRGARPPGTS